MESILLPKEKLELYLNFIRQIQDGDLSIHMDDSTSEPELIEFESELAKLAIILDSRFSQFSSICDITIDISKGGLLEDVLSRIYDSFQRIIPYDRIGCALLTDDLKQLQAIWAKTNYPSQVQLSVGYTAPLAGSSLELIMNSQQPRIINDLKQYFAEHPHSESTQYILKEGIQSSLTCPLIADNKPLGFLFFSSKELNTYKDVHQKAFIFISRQVSILVAKSRLYQHIYDLNKQLTDALSCLKEQSCRDPLTNVLHRGAIMEFLIQSLSIAERKGQHLSVIMADLDHFKNVNDTYGHLTGDTVLREVCSIITSQLRAYDSVGRYGGEEFLIILTDIDKMDAFLVTERIRKSISKHQFEHPMGNFSITMSFGIASTETGILSGDTETLLLSADAALYQAKHDGRNRTFVA